MRGSRLPFLLGLVVFYQVVCWGGTYRIKDLQIKPARSYRAHQDFQNVTIGAYPCETREKSIEIFDTPSLHAKKYLPVLIVVENNNDFPIYIQERHIFLVDPGGKRQAVLPFIDVLLDINLKEPLASYPASREVLLQTHVEKEMFIDFENKAFGNKQIFPRKMAFGIVFFPLPSQGRLEGHKLYFPSVYNVLSREALIFFEFDLTGKDHE